MKGYDFTFEKGLRGGLRKHYMNPLNEEALVECHNLAPTESGLEPHEDVVLIGAAADFFLLMESGDYILMEDHDGNTMMNRVVSTTATVITLQIASTVAMSDTTDDDIHKLHQVEAILI